MCAGYRDGAIAEINVLKLFAMEQKWKLSTGRSRTFLQSFMMTKLKLIKK